MKKLLLVLLGIVVVVVVIQKFGLLNYFFKTPSKPLIKKQTSDTLSTEPSRAIDYPLIGIYYKMIDKQTADQNGLTEGAYVTQVIKDSPAEKSDIREEDVITEIDSRIITDLDKQSIYNLISTLKSGTKISLKIWRNKEIKNIIVILE
ncbi:MAG: PDZ domain-containing protein [Candidatus Roizmanbacteria bacterium]|nr:PDZ domain-containing protein [Candidatus Roizmanbacteria bacterium]MCR4313413.1 PDZ domain-containing protein [Candidatus Roizmanbacteria bacterium]